MSGIRIPTWKSRGAPLATSTALGPSAILAIVLAGFTGAAAAVVGGSGWHVVSAIGYIASAVLAIIVPGALVVQVIAGQVLAGSVLLASDPSLPLLAMPVVASVIATAELIAVAGRPSTPVERDVRDDARRVGIATIVGAAVYGVIILVGEVPGPSGLPAIALGSAACVAIAMLLANRGTT